MNTTLDRHDGAVLRVGVTLGVRVGVRVTVDAGVAEPVLVPVCVPDCDSDGARLCEGVRDPVYDVVGVTLSLAPVETDDDPVCDDDGELDALLDAEAVPDAEPDALPLDDGLGNRYW